MRPRRSKSIVLTVALFCAVGLMSLGCRTTRTLPDGTQVKEFDPVKTENVKAVAESLVTSPLRRIMQNSPGHKEEIGNYLRAIGGVFCQMSATSKFEPAFLIDEINKATANLKTGIDPYIFEIKDGLIALYRINYNARHTAELSPEKWPKNLADVLCNSVHQALLDVQLPGVKS